MFPSHHFRCSFLCITPCFYTCFSPSKKLHLYPSMPPLAYSAHLFCLSSTSLLVPTFHLHCIADFCRAGYRKADVQLRCTCFPLIMTASFLPIPRQIKWDTAVTCPTRITRTHKHACTHIHNPSKQQFTFKVSYLLLYHYVVCTIHRITRIFYMTLTAQNTFANTHIVQS